MRILHLITRMDRGGSAGETLILAVEQLKQGHHVVLAMGLSEESDMSADEAHRADEAIAVFRVLAALMKMSKIYIGNDSGPSHLAAAVGVPSVVLFGPGDVDRHCPRG